MLSQSLLTVFLAPIIFLLSFSPLLPLFSLISLSSCSLSGGSVNKEEIELGFPGGAVVKNPPANAGNMGSSPGQGRSLMPQSN